MDLAMPGTDGVQATLALRATSPETKVLVLTSFADEDHVISAIQAGAAGYLMKDTPPEEVVDAVRTIIRGDPLVHREALRALVRGLADANRPPEGTVTLVFTDVEGSAALFDRLGDERAHALLRAHDAILRRAIK